MSQSNKMNRGSILSLSLVINVYIYFVSFFPLSFLQEVINSI